MSEIVSVKFNVDNNAINLMNKRAVKGLFKLGYDIAAQARQRAPYVTGALRSTIRVQETKDNVVEVIAGGSYGGKKVNYAWKREKGPNKNPATEHYMEYSAQSIMNGDYLRTYFGDIL